MDRDEVFLALGRHERKLRETKDGVDSEDWIFGRPPGKMVFVTFEGSKVVKVKETYAGLGAEAAAPLEIAHFSKSGIPEEFSLSELCQSK